MLSIGEQKLIAFARAMLCRPALLFLDEWTESLDDEAAQRLVGLVRRFKSEGNTLIFISHDHRLVAELPDYVIIVSGGKVSATIPRAELARNGKLADLYNRRENESKE
jgi:ABC-type multidrug transport system ATPase subunit